MNWIQIAKELPINSKTTGFCPEGCSTSPKAYINHSTKDYWIYCNKCGYTDRESKGKLTLADLERMKKLNESAQQELPLELPDDYTTEIPRAGRLWLYKAGITEPLWKKYRIGYSAKLERVVLPVYDKSGVLIWLQCRAVHKGQIPKYIQPARDRSNVLFFSRGYSETAQHVVITEDILSAIRVGECTGTCSILGTKITTEQATILAKHREVITWLDGDSAGRKGAYKIRKTLGLVTEVRNIVTDVDPKELTNKEIKECLNIS